jgi:outer membrane lipoprotein-sorting protein
MRLALLAVMLLACGCPNTGGTGPRPPDLTIKDVLDRLAKAREARTSFTTESTMDFWMGNQRRKGDVLVMGKPGAKVRFAALSPAGGSTIVEMACDGTNYVLVDQQNNCTLTGPCDQHSIAQFFRIELAPDDFVHLALGTPPVLANATGTVTWDSSTGYERVELTGPDGKQKLAIDTRDGKFDVIESEFADADGSVRWNVANADFGDVGGQRLPGKTRFKSPGDNEDLLVEWGSNRQINVELDNSKFVLEAPAGLSSCGQQAPAAPPPPPSSSRPGQPNHPP